MASVKMDSGGTEDVGSEIMIVTMGKMRVTQDPAVSEMTEAAFFGFRCSPLLALREEFSIGLQHILQHHLIIMKHYLVMVF